MRGGASPGHPYNRHLFISDNYKLLQSLDTESIDLITTDPPFKKNYTFEGSLKPPLSKREIDVELAMLGSWGTTGPDEAARAGIEWPTGKTTAEFKDRWSWEGDVHEEWMEMIAEDWPAIREVIEAAQHAHSPGQGAYIAYMAVRLIECHRILKPTGSLYLHCDYAANSYLRVLLDAIFGQKHFRNEIVWDYKKVSNSKAKKFLRAHDTILFYGKTDTITYNPLFETELSPRKKKLVKAGYNTKRQNGERYLYIYDEAKVVAREAAGQFHRSDFDHIVKVDTTRGNRYSDIFRINWINPKSPENTGYPTQKPWALAERLIRASTNEGDVVLDPFAGCAYTAVAAEGLGRQWIACDISPRALTVLRRQFAKKEWAIDGVVPEGMLPSQSMAACNVTVKGPGDIPKRDRSADLVKSVKPLPPRKFKKAASDMPEADMKSMLAELAGYQCWACGFALRDVNGTVVESIDYFHLDHIEPKSAGGSNFVHNRGLLCAPCNSAKSSQRIPLKAFRDELAVAARRASYGHGAYPVDIDEVHEKAMIRWSEWRTAKGLDAPQLELG